ncbi:MAG: HAD family hydrolase [Gaiellaceae bacterium]
MVKAVVFDFNGTLSDDEPVLARIYIELLGELGAPLTEAEYYEHLAGHTDEEMFTRWLGRSDASIIAERVRRYNERVADGSTVDADVRAAVAFAKERLPVALVSAALIDEIAPVVSAAALEFDVIVSQDDVDHGKPSPEPYERAARKLGVDPSELLVFEDTDVGVASAKAAGAYVVGLTRTLGAERMAAADELADRIDTKLMERLLCS